MVPSSSTKLHKAMGQKVLGIKRLMFWKIKIINGSLPNTTYKDELQQTKDLYVKINKYLKWENVRDYVKKDFDETQKHTP